MKGSSYEHLVLPMNEPLCVATFHIIFREIDIKLLETKLGEWAERVLKLNLNLKTKLSL